MADESLYLMSGLEIPWGTLVGHIGTLPPPTRPITDPRTVLEDVVAEALSITPCGVAFSGGRDSSAVLAVATHVARREGLPEPLPITIVYPGDAAAEEGEWQETVVRHLGLREWQRVVIDDELDMIGPLSTPRLLEHGVVWPPAITADAPLLDAVPGGSVLTGEGGDEVLGVLAHRVAPVTRLYRRPRPLHWRRVRAAMVALAPKPLRARRAHRRWSAQARPWLRPAAKDALVAELTRVELDQPLSFAKSVRMVPRRRTQVLGGRNRRIIAARRGVHLASPLLHPDFVHALARDGGMLGRGDRTMVLQALLSDLLPNAVSARTSKASFNTCYMSRHTREFAEGWTGGGVDLDLVDGDALREAWLSERPPTNTGALLQAAWLASNRPALSGPAEVANEATS